MSGLPVETSFRVQLSLRRRRLGTAPGRALPGPPALPPRGGLQEHLRVALDFVTQLLAASQVTAAQISARKCYGMGWDGTGRGGMG